MERRREKETRKKKADIDWGEVRQRLDLASERLNRGITPEKERELLKARALSLARETGGEDANPDCLEILEFSLASERYGIEIGRVRETMPLKQFTPVPCTPPHVLGLVNVRGRILSVIDIKKFFDLPEKGITDLNKIIILHAEGMEFGILADSVRGVRKIRRADLQPSLPTLTGIRQEYLMGVTEERLVVLDAARLLGDRKIVVNEETGGQPSL